MQAQRFWTRAYQRYIGKMIGVCCRYVGDRALAEDLAHESFLKAIEKSDRYHRLGSFEGWLMRVNLNNTLDYLRRQPQFLRIDDMDLVDSSQSIETSQCGVSDNKTDETINANDFTETEILDAIAQLPERHRTVFNLYVFEKQKHSKIAETLQIGVRSSKRYLAEARTQLQQTLTNKHEHKKSGIMVLLSLITLRAHAIDRVCRAKLGHLTLAPTAPSPLGALNWAAAPKPSAWLTISAAKVPTIASLSGVGVVAAVAGSVTVWQAQPSESASPNVPTQPVVSQTIVALDTIMEDVMPMPTLNGDTVGIPVETQCIASLPHRPDRAIQPEPTDPPLPETSKVPAATSSKNHSLKIFQRHGYCGLADEQGNVVVCPKYSCIHPYDECRSGWAMVELFGFKGFIDSTGKEVVHPQYDEIGKFGYYQDGKALVRKGNCYGFIDLSGKEVVPVTKKKEEITVGY